MNFSALAVEITRSVLYRAWLSIPARVPVGRYTAETFLIRNGKIIAAATRWFAASIALRTSPGSVGTTASAIAVAPAVAVPSAFGPHAESRTRSTVVARNPNGRCMRTTR